MAQPEQSRLSFHGPARFLVTVEGVIPPSLRDRLGDMEVQPPAGPDDRTPRTVLVGHVPDQPALLGTLMTLHDFGLPIRSVQYLLDSAEPETEGRPDGFRYSQGDEE